ncbi:BON1-associated protein 2 [Diospyros lotus]|uniref:BON1-associated protein 2 n=1 Tax=Diospyros lotus TaxID=55363 RepID=UPI002253B4C1|nr:BON1-associated protein 2 [Diospyros lotus]
METLTRMEKETRLLEINLISAQGLKPPSGNLRRLQTYAMAWVDPSAKLRTRVDRLGAENPTWNEKFLFRVSSDFLSSETSGVSVEIYAVGYIKDPLVGTVRFLLGRRITAAVGTPAFTAVQIRRPSGRFHGVLNIAATVLDGLDFAAITGLPAVCFRDLAKESCRRQRRHGRKGSEKTEISSGGESGDFSCGDSVDLSDGGDSTTSSSSTASTVFKERNCERTEMAGKSDLKSDGAGMLCGLMQRKIHLPSDQLSIVLAEKEN